MTAHYQLVPLKAVEAIESAGVPHAQRLIRDRAASGLVKSYAAQIVTIEARGEPTIVLGCTMPTSLWRRIVREGADDDIWTGGMICLASGDMIGGMPYVEITGIGFNTADVHRLIEEHSRGGHPGVTRAKAKVAPPSSIPHYNAEAAMPAPKLKHPAPNLSALHSGALLLTVAETKAALAIGHTKFYKLLNAGQLERAPGAGGTRVIAASVRRYAGVSD